MSDGDIHEIGLELLILPLNLNANKIKKTNDKHSLFGSYSHI